MTEQNILGVKALAKLREFLNRTTNEDLLCSSFYEFTPWHRYGYGFIVLCRLTGVRIKIRDILRPIKSSFSNLFLKSKICVAPATNVSFSSNIIFTWLVDEGETRQACLVRYYGLFANDPSVSRSHVWAIAVSQPSCEAIKRLNAEGVSLVWKTRPSLRDLFYVILRMFSGLHPILLIDPEYWTGSQLAGAFVRWLQTVKISQPQILLAYEQQPWQLALITAVKKTFGERSKIVGDAHSSLANFPSQFIKTKICPDRIITHGNGLRRVLVHQLGWADENVDISPSRRFTQRLCYSASQIVLPYTMNTHTTIVEAVRLISASHANVSSWHVRPHPARMADSKYRETVVGIQSFVEKLNHAQAATENIIILVYGFSTLIFEALESGYEVYNLLDNPVLEGLSPDIWDGL
ncbi:MAG: hypothetical protein NTV34_20570, partial [Proteobacteria bacterium]|nr:hypothetical protein [Pseudomonadota bacterium]